MLTWHRRICGCTPTPTRRGETLLVAAACEMGLSARAYHRVLKLARTIADLTGEDCINPAPVAEAQQRRPRVTEG
jgi:magnesium chelatase family protein